MAYGIMTDERFLLHRARFDHPESPERLRAIMGHLEHRGLLKDCTHIPARPALMAELEQIHSSNYIQHTLKAIENGWGYLDPDTFYSPGTFDAVLGAAGGTIDLAKAVYRKELDFGFAFNRPPGHHSTPDRAMGFCLFNHVAVATATLLKEGAERILVFDWDVHHGNGTQDAFFGDPRVLYISIHQWPLFPGSGLNREIGQGEGRGYTVNIPLSAGATDADYILIMERIVEPLAAAYKPEAVIVSAGFDAHHRDMLAGMSVTGKGFAEMTRRVAKIASSTGRGPCFVLEGGYDLDGLKEGVDAVFDTMNGRHTPHVHESSSRRCSTSIESTLEAIVPYWPNL